MKFIFEKKKNYYIITEIFTPAKENIIQMWFNIFKNKIVQ